MFASKVVGKKAAYMTIGYYVLSYKLNDFEKKKLLKSVNQSFLTMQLTPLPFHSLLPIPPKRIYIWYGKIYDIYDKYDRENLMNDKENTDSNNGNSPLGYF